MTGTPLRTTYRERLTPAPWIWAVVVGIAVAFGIIVDRFSDPAAVATVIGVTALQAAALRATTPTVAVADGVLTAGRARVPVDLLGTVEVLDAAAMRTAIGPGLDARSYLCIRGWIPTGVRVALVDPQDPTPYWVISSRRPDQLAAALAAARG